MNDIRLRHCEQHLMNRVKVKPNVEKLKVVEVARGHEVAEVARGHKAEHK